MPNVLSTPPRVTAGGKSVHLAGRAGAESSAPSAALASPPSRPEWSGTRHAVVRGVQCSTTSRPRRWSIQSPTAVDWAGQLRIDERIIFKRMARGHQQRRYRLAKIYEQRFRPEFIPAYECGSPRTHFSHKPSHPARSTNRSTARVGRPGRARREAGNRYQQGTRTRRTANATLLSTVFFAAVRFLIGNLAEVEWRSVRTRDHISGRDVARTASSSS